MDRPNGSFSPRVLRAGCAGLALLLALPVASEAGLFRRKRSKKPPTTQAAPGQIVGIVVEPLPDGLRIQIDCSSRVRSRWGTLNDSDTFYVDLEGAQISNALRHVLIGSAGLNPIRSENLSPTQVRISLGLRDGVRPRVERSDDGRSVTLRLKTPELIPGTATPLPPLPPLVEPSRPPACDPAPSPGASLAPGTSTAAARVTAIEVENVSAGEAVVRVQTEGTVGSWRWFPLKGPARVVVELSGAEHCVQRPRFQGTGPLSLGSVRSAQFTRDPLVTRVVVQLPGDGTLFKVEPPDRSGELRIRVGSAAAATARALPVLAGAQFPPGLHVGIDPGHGGSDPGAINERVGIHEKEITLDIARRLARLLEDAGVRVSMTRRDDRRLEKTERIRFVSRGNADVFVSIHCDAHKQPHVTGVTTYHHGSRASGRELAAALQARLPAVMGLPDRGVRSDFSRFPGEGFYILRYARMPAVLIECGYVSHAGTAQQMAKPAFRQQVAQGIADGLRNYFEEHALRSRRAALPD